MQCRYLDLDLDLAMIYCNLTTFEIFPEILQQSALMNLPVNMVLWDSK